jgi:hypothetical protein
MILAFSSREIVVELLSEILFKGFKKFKFKRIKSQSSKSVPYWLVYS